MTLHITQHAIERYQERVANLPDCEVIQALNSPAVFAAAEFGGECHVRLPTGQRIVVKDYSVITVTPAPLVRRCRTGKAKGAQG